MMSGGWDPHDGDSALTRKDTRELVLALSLPWEDTVRRQQSRTLGRT